MDRRDFLKKAAQLIGTSMAGISLTKLQIATIATGLSGAAGCARNPVGDPANGDSLFASCPPCQTLHACENNVYNCSGPEFTCTSAPFECDAPKKFMCNADKFVCSKKFDCPQVELFECKDFSIIHQGSLTIG